MEFDASDLVTQARDARRYAYAPYSGYAVGAAVITASGRVFKGTNVENASYGLTICAERTALVKAVSEGDHAITAIAVVAPGGASMCGACRQFLREFGDTISIYLADESGPHRESTIAKMLPAAFSAGPNGFGRSGGDG